MPVEDGCLNYYCKLPLFPVIKSASGMDTCHLSALGIHFLKQTQHKMDGHVWKRGSLNVQSDFLKFLSIVSVILM